MIYDSVIWKEELEKKLVEFREYLSGELVLDDEVLAIRLRSSILSQPLSFAS